MTARCQRCYIAFSAGPLAPGGILSCPSCGSTDVAAVSPTELAQPTAANHHSPSQVDAEYSQPVSRPQQAEPFAPPIAAPLVQTAPHPPLSPYGAYPAPVHQNQPPAYQQNPYGGGYPQQYQQPQTMAQQPINIVIQNQVAAPYPIQMPMYPQYPMAQYVRRKDAGIATLMSFLLPGGGQLYNGQVGKGVAFLLVTFFVNLPLLFVGVGFITGLATWIWSMADAHSTAEQINRGFVR